MPEHLNQQHDEAAGIPDGLYGDAVAQGEVLHDRGVAVTEVGLNDTGVVTVPSGESGAIGTHELNGCHATVMVVREPDDSRTAMMAHFPPSGFLPTRYRETLGRAAEDVATRGAVIEQVVRVVDGGRQDTDAKAVAEAFPDQPVAAITYDTAQFRGRRLERAEPVSCLAVIDDTAQQPSLRIVAGGHEMELPLGSGSQHGDAVAADDSKPVSTELVPFAEHRRSWNTVHVNSLEAHDDALSHADAERINAHYDIRVYVGSHGYFATEEEKSADPYHADDLPTQLEYDEMAKVVDGMRPGDTLFVEGHGHETSQMVPLRQPEDPLVRAGTTGLLRRVMLGGLASKTPEDIRADLDHKRQELERLRAEYRISTIEYAQRLARIKGIRTVHADHDAFEVEASDVATGATLPELLRSKDPGDQRTAARRQRRRDRKAVNTLKDDALRNLPPDDVVIPDDQKPALVMLYGGRHKASLQHAFDVLHIDTEVIGLRQSSLAERREEQLRRRHRETAGMLAVAAMTHAGGSIPDILATAAVAQAPARAAKLAGLMPKASNPFSSGGTRPARHLRRGRSSGQGGHPTGRVEAS